ncbi:MAG: hypothetical protein J2P24_13605 [Streptosporangiales bacterium]|nr:hypothetical protein [Streptosporangiales bacterium]
MRARKARQARPASRVLALIMGVSLIIVGLVGLVWHLLGIGYEWIFGGHYGFDIFHLVAGIVALGAGGSKVSAKAFGWLAFVVFGAGMIVSALAAFLQRYEHLPSSVPHLLADNTLGFTNVNYILYLLMALWGLLLAHSAIRISDEDTGEKHDVLRALPDREDVINENRRRLITGAND